MTPSGRPAGRVLVLPINSVDALPRAPERSDRPGVREVYNKYTMTRKDVLKPWSLG